MRIRIIKVPDSIKAQGLQEMPETFAYGGYKLDINPRRRVYASGGQIPIMIVPSPTLPAYPTLDNTKVISIQTPSTLNRQYLFAEGGDILGGYHTNGMDWEQPGDFNVIGAGGTHEQNANEGVQQGVDQEGTPNLVEEKEVVYNDYVYSNRLRVPKTPKLKKGKDKEISDIAWEQKMLKPYEEMTYADAAKKAVKNSQERPDDNISKNGAEVILGILAGSQEKERAKKQYTDAASEIDKMSGEEFMAKQEQERMALEMAKQQQAQQIQEAQLAQLAQQGQPSPEEQMAMQQQLTDPMQQLMQQLAMQEQAMQQYAALQQAMQEQAIAQQLAQQQALQQLIMQQLAMQQAQLAPIAALGGNLHAYGGNFYDNGGQIDLARYQLIFQQIAQYAQQLAEKGDSNLYKAVQQVRNPQQMMLFVLAFLALQELQRVQAAQQQAALYAQAQEAQQYAQALDYANMGYDDSQYAYGGFKKKVKTFGYGGDQNTDFGKWWKNSHLNEMSLGLLRNFIALTSVMLGDQDAYNEVSKLNTEEDAYKYLDKLLKDYKLTSKELEGIGHYAPYIGALNVNLSTPYSSYPQPDSDEFEIQDWLNSMYNYVYQLGGQTPIYNLDNTTLNESGEIEAFNAPSELNETVVTAKSGRQDPKLVEGVPNPEIPLIKPIKDLPAVHIENKRTVLTDKQRKELDRLINRTFRENGIDIKKLDSEQKKYLESYRQSIYDRASENPDYNYNKDPEAIHNKLEFKTTTKINNREAFNQEVYLQNRLNEGMTLINPSMVNDGKIGFGDKYANGLTKVEEDYLKSLPNIWGISGEDVFKEDNPYGISDFKTGIQGKDRWTTLPEYKLNVENGETAEQQRSRAEQDFLDFYRKELLKFYGSDGVRKKNDSGEEGDYSNWEDYQKAFLSPQEFKNWITYLRRADATDKEKFLADILEEQWAYNPKTNQYEESQSYLDHVDDAIKRGLITAKSKEDYLKKDRKLGVQHHPFLDVVSKAPNTGVMYYYNDNGKMVPVMRPSTDEWEISDTPVYNHNYGKGIVMYEVKPKNPNRVLHKDPWGRFYDATNAKGHYTSTDKKAEDDLTGVGYGYNPKTSWVNPLISEDDDPFPEAESWPALAAAGLLAGLLGYNIARPIDRRNAEALLKTSSAALDVPDSDVYTIGDYLPYDPFNLIQLGIGIGDLARATYRAIVNSSAGNAGMNIASQLAADNNYLNALGDAYMKAKQENLALRAQIAEYNRGTNQYNAEALNKNELARLDASMKGKKLNLEGSAQAYAMMEQQDQDKANAISAGMSGLANNLYSYAQQEHQNDMLGWGIRHNIWGPMRAYYDKNGSIVQNTGAEGGLLKIRRTKKGLL